VLFGSKLKSALKKALADPAAAAEILHDVSREQVTTVSEAELVVQVLKLFPLPSGSESERVAGSVLHDVIAWMQRVDDEKAVSVFKRFGAPELLRVFDDCFVRAQRTVESGMRILAEHDPGLG
jgi:hypothetical protein